MTQSDPQAPLPIDYGLTDGRRRSNGAAVASFVLGMLGCVPFITGLLAIWLGIRGNRKARVDPSIGGRGFATAGIVLGIASFLVWSAFAAILGEGYLESQPAKVVADQFLRDVSAGKTAAAMNGSGGFTSAQIQTFYNQLGPYGTLQSTNLPSFNYSPFSGAATMRVSGVATFKTLGARACTFDLMKVNGTYKVMSFWVQ